MESVTSFVKWRIWPWRFPKFLVWILLGSEVKAGLGWSPFGAEMNQVLSKRRKRECQGEEEGQCIQETPILDKHEKREPAELKSWGHQGRKRICGLLVKIKDSGRWETQPPNFHPGSDLPEQSSRSVSEHPIFSALTDLPVLRGKCLEFSLFQHQVIWLLQENAALQMPQVTSKWHKWRGCLKD